MNKTKKPARTTAEIHRLVADQVIEAMKTSGSDWVKSWSAPDGCLPTSMSTGKQYQGINLLLLGMARATFGYGSSHWATYSQWKKQGANVRKGEKSTTVIFYKPLNIRNKETGESETIPLLKTFSIFNADQVDGYDSPAVVDSVDHTKLTQPETLADGLARRVGCEVRYNDPSSAFYSPQHDFVNMPLATQFDTVADYAATLLHELTHWTGHKSRLDRKLVLKSGAKDYAKEELVAELGAAMLCGSLGLSPAPRADHAKYLSHWLERLKDEPKVIFSAASKARAAADWIQSADSQDRLAE